MKENSRIEKDIKIVEDYLENSAINEIESNFFKNSGWETVDLEIPKSMQHILSDYKRVLKENEELKKFLRMGSEVAENSILIPKIKCKIEELDIEISECEYSDDDDEKYKKAVEKDKLCLLNQKRALQELVEESEE